MEIDSQEFARKASGRLMSGVRKQIQTIFTFCQRIERKQTDGILAKEMS